MTATKNASSGANGTFSPSSNPAPVPAVSATTNPLHVQSSDFQIAVIGVLTPFGVVQVVTTDRYAKALSHN